MALLTYEVALETLVVRLKGVCDDAISPPIPFTQRNASNQKLTTQHLQMHIMDTDPIGVADNYEYGKSAKQYEVMVELSCHGKSPNSNMGSTTAKLQRVLHTFEGHSGVYYKHFTSQDISFLRSGTIRRRDFPLDKVQWEERSSVVLVFGMMVVVEDPVEIGYIETIEVNKLRVKDTPTHIAIERDFDVVFSGEYVNDSYVTDNYVEDQQ